MKNESIIQEIKELKKIRANWCNTFKTKSNAHNLLTEISIFKHTFSVHFPNSVKYFNRNSHAEINFTDAISDLKRYSSSKLKVKDDDYFINGLNNIHYGINNLIMSLEMELESNEKE